MKLPDDTGTVEAAVEMLKDTDYILEGFIGGKAYIEKEYYDHVKKTGRSFRDVNYILDTRNPIEDLLRFSAGTQGARGKHQRQF